MDSSTTLKVSAECMGACPKDDPDEILSVPPGFAPVMTFALKRMQENAVTSGCASDSKQTHMDAQCSPVGNEKFKKSLRNRRCVDYSQFDNSSDDESDYELFEQDIPVIRCLPKGVIRGCTECRNCQKVTARWHPEDSRRPNLDEAPVFYPTEEEFKDTLKYIASIRPSAEPFGICRIIPPPSWTSSCPLKEKDVWENSKFATRIQRVDKLQNRDSMKKNSKNRGNTMRKRRKLLKTGQECRSTNGNPMQTNELANYNNAERFGFEPGPDFTLESFQKYADEFREQYFQRENMDSRQWEPLVENIEGEYWRIIEKPTEQIEVLYGADLDTGTFGSGFPKDSSTLTNYDIEDQLAKSGWNLNNLPRLPGSVLSFESGDISGVLVPWLYIGMCFSSFCWHVEDHHLYSLNYMHWGAPKVWYGVPGKDALKLEAAMKKHLSALFEEQPDLLHNLVTQFSPSILKLEGVPVYRCVQHPGDFVLTFPRAYHSGFNCGFNCAEAVNIAPVDWLPHGQNAVELYHQQERKISISHDKLLLEAARVAARAQWNILFLGNDSLENLRWKGFCGPNGILTKALKGRIEVEKERRECFSCSSQSRKMDPDFTANIERECFVCHYDLHLSAVGCACSPDRFACLVHAKQLCSCAWSTRFFLFRYEINELNVLADALGDKLSAVHRWGLSDLGLSLSSRVNKEKSQDSKAIKKASLDEAKQMDNTPNNQYKLTSDGRGCSLSQEIKTSTLKPLSEGAREREKVAISAVNLSCKITDCSILHQQNKSMTCSALKEQCLDGGPLLKSHKKEILEYPRYRDSDLSSPDLLDHEHSRESTRNTNLLQSTSSEQKSISCPVLAANSKPLSNSDNIESKTDENLSSSDVGVTLLRHDEHEGAHRVLSGKKKEDPIVENSEAFARLTKCDDQVISSNTPNDQVLVTPETNASEMNENENDLIPLTEECGNILKLKTPEVKDEEKDGICGGDLSTLSDQLVEPFNQNASHSMNRAGVPITRQPLKLLAVKDMGDCSRTDNGIHQEESLLSGIRKPNDESKEGRSESDTDCHHINRGDSTQTSTSHPQNNADRYNRPQKGPRMAKVVRRLNINVEPLEYGVVFSGKLWSSSQAIFPKGFRSRVRYLSILNPTQMCYYVSEILDAGLLGPLFMVMLEHCPSEVFIHVSATKCWDMVREKLNNEIRRLHSMGQVNLPSLQPPGSVDGLEMFGLSSPAIIKAIEAIDQDRVCMEYWRSMPQVQAPSVPSTSVGDNRPGYKEPDSQNSSSLGGTDVALGSLLEKATLEELHALYGILRNDEAKTKQDVKKFLSDEIESRRN